MPHLPPTSIVHLKHLEYKQYHPSAFLWTNLTTKQLYQSKANRVEEKKQIKPAFFRYYYNYT